MLDGRQGGQCNGFLPKGRGKHWCAGLVRDSNTSLDIQGIYINIYNKRTTFEDRSAPSAPRDLN